MVEVAAFTLTERAVLLPIVRLIAEDTKTNKGQGWLLPCPALNPRGQGATGDQEKSQTYSSEGYFIPQLILWSLRSCAVLVDCSVNNSTNCFSTDGCVSCRVWRSGVVDERTQTFGVFFAGCRPSALGADRSGWARGAASGPTCAGVVGLGPGRADRGHRTLERCGADELVVSVAALSAAGR